MTSPMPTQNSQAPSPQPTQGVPVQKVLTMVEMMKTQLHKVTLADTRLSDTFLVLFSMVSGLIPKNATSLETTLYNNIREICNRLMDMLKTFSQRTPQEPAHVDPELVDRIVELGEYCKQHRYDDASAVHKALITSRHWSTIQRFAPSLKKLIEDSKLAQ